MLPPTLYYLVWIRFQRKLSLVTTFTIYKWLKKYYSIDIKIIGRFVVRGLEKHLNYIDFFRLNQKWFKIYLKKIIKLKVLINHDNWVKDLK